MKRDDRPVTVMSCDSEQVLSMRHSALGNFSPYHNHRLTRYTMFDQPKNFVIKDTNITEVHGNSYGKLLIKKGVVCSLENLRPGDFVNNTSLDEKGHWFSIS